VDHFSVKGLHLDLDQRSPTSRNQAKLENTSLQLQLHWANNQFTSSGSFQLGNAAQVSTSSVGSQQKEEIHALFSASAQWEAGIRLENSQWVYEIHPSDVTFKVKDLTILQSTQDSAVKVSLPELNLESKARLLAKTQGLLKVDQASIETLKANTVMRAGPLQLHLTQSGETERVHVRSQETALDIDLSQAIEVQLRSIVSGVSSSSLPGKPILVDFRSTAQIAKDLREATVQGVGTLNQMQFLQFNLQSHLKDALTVQGNLGLTIGSRLVEALQPASDSNQLGSLRADATLKGELKTLDLNSPASAEIQVAVTQDKKKGAIVKFDPIHIQTNLSRKADSIHIKADATLPKVEHEVLQSPLNLSLATETQLNLQKNQVDFVGQVQVQNSEFGRWLSKTRLGLNLDKNLVQAHGNTTIHQEVLAKASQLPILLPEPITIDHKVDINHDKAQISITTRIPSIEVTHLGKILDTQCTTQIQSNDFNTAQNFDIAVDFKQGDFLVAKSLLPSKTAHPLSLAGLNAKLRAELRGDHRFTMKELTAEFNHSMLKLVAEAKGDSKAQDFQTQGSMVLNIPPQFPQIAGQKLTGRIEFPWTLTIYHGREIDVEGNMSIIDLNWSKHAQLDSPIALHMRGISGRIPVSEQLIWNGRKIKFAHIMSRNPFERVDFERLQPLILDSEQVDIREIGFEEKTYGPFQGFFSARQNMIYAHKFSFKIASGHAHGELFLDTSNLQLGLLSRLTELDLTEILPKKYQAISPTGDHRNQKMSGRTGMVINLNSNNIDGKVDVTEIGGSQLITLINAMDPKYENEQMNRARFALGIAYPTAVEMSFQNGFMDMGIQLNGFVSQNLRGIAISPWISQAKGEMFKKTQEGTRP
jgi:hypothetical protein